MAMRSYPVCQFSGGRRSTLAGLVRLDCFLSSASLVACYERNGFASVGTAIMRGKTTNLMEKAI